MGGVGYARRVVEESLATFDEAGIGVEAIESETFALPRALLRNGNEETVLVIDIGKTTTKLMGATSRLPRFVTTLDVGGMRSRSPYRSTSTSRKRRRNA